eukprot:jgi/Chlat1/875/Chrsp107S00037
MARMVTYTLYESLSTKVNDAVVAAYEQGATVDDKARRLSASGVGAGAWLSALPFLPALRISADLFGMALRTRLGLPHPMLAGVTCCPCGVGRCTPAARWGQGALPRMTPFVTRRL